MQRPTEIRPDDRRLEPVLGGEREVAMLGMFADFVRFGGQKAAELEEAGYHEQAVELRGGLPR